MERIDAVRCPVALERVFETMYVSYVWDAYSGPSRCFWGSCMQRQFNRLFQLLSSWEGCVFIFCFSRGESCCFICWRSKERLAISNETAVFVKEK